MLIQDLPSTAKTTECERRGKGMRWASPAVYILSFVVIAMARPQDLNPYDEGLVLVGASRVMVGEIPYRDFWTMYGPGQFYAIAALMLVFGKYAIVERIYDGMLRAAIVWLSFRIMRRFAGRFTIGVALSAILVLLASTGSDGFPVIPALAFSLAGFLFTIRSFDTVGRSWAPFKAGLCAGAAALFRHDLGFYAVVTCAFGLTTIEILRGGPLPAMVRAAARSVALAAFGCATVALPALALLFGTVPLHDLYQNLIDIPLHVYPDVRRLPFPRLFALKGPSLDADLRQRVVYVPFLVIAVAGMALGNAFARGPGRRVTDRADRSVEAAVATLLVGTALFAIKGLVRVSPEHMFHSVVCAVVTLAVATRLPLASRGLPRMAIWGASALAAVSLSAFGVQSAGLMAANAPWSARVRSCLTPLTPSIRCFLVNPDMSRVVEFVQDHTSPDDRIYVGPGRHDKIFANDIMLYFAAQRLPGTKWHDSHPGVQTTRPVQVAMASDLDRTRAKLVIADRTYDDVAEANGSRLSSGVTAFDDYIAQHYDPVFRSGNFTVYERRS